jgi:hypothetical protein
MFLESLAEIHVTGLPADVCKLSSGAHATHKLRGLMQVGARRIDFVNEGIDSIEVKMPPPWRMREAALAVCTHSILSCGYAR